MNEYPSLLDLAKLKGTDLAVGVVDNASRFCPEVTRIPGRPIMGTSYDISVLTSKGRGGFRSANEGVETTKSKYDKQHVESFIFDAQLEVDKAVADAAPFGRESYLSEQALTQTEGNFEALGEQFYYGTTADSKGFLGISQNVEAALRVNAAGDTADECTSVYAVFADIRGAHFVYGANGAIDVSDEWRVQKIVRDNKSLTAYVNGMTFWIGLQIAPKAVGRIANLDFDHLLTDKMVAELLSKFPMRTTPNLLLMNRRAAYQLQSSRSAVTIQNGPKSSTSIENWAPAPTESNGVPIIVTESIKDTESVVSFS